MLDNIDRCIKKIENHKLTSAEAGKKLDTLKLSYGKPRARLATKYQAASFAFFLFGCLFAILYMAMKATA